MVPGPDVGTQLLAAGLQAATAAATEPCKNILRGSTCVMRDHLQMKNPHSATRVSARSLAARVDSAREAITEEIERRDQRVLEVDARRHAGEVDAAGAQGLRPHAREEQ